MRKYDMARLAREWIPRRRIGYLAGGVLALATGAILIASYGPATPGRVTEATVDSAALAAAAAARAAAAVAEAARRDSIAAAEEAAARLALEVTAADFSFEPITDGVPRVSRPEAERGLYLNAWAAGSTRKLANLIAVANRTEINTFVIDVKEGGEISYQSRVPLAARIDASRSYIGDVRGVLRQLRENGIFPVARIVVFKDGRLAHARPQLAVRQADGSEWLDADGNAWVDSFNRKVWDYNIAIAREALELGFSAVQWDYVRFPDVPTALMRAAVWPARDGRSKEDGIREFLEYSRSELAEYGAPVTADVFGLTVSARNDMGIGQLWEKMVDVSDALLPMVYPSHFAPGSYNIAHPNASPYETVLKAMEYARRRTDDVANGARIMPWLQDFTLGSPRYGPEYVRAQIDAVHDAGIREWVLWNPGSNYTFAALADVAGNRPDLGPPPVPGAQIPVDSAAGAEDTTGTGAGGRPLGTPVRDDR